MSEEVVSNAVVKSPHLLSFFKENPLCSIEMMIEPMITTIRSLTTKNDKDNQTELLKCISANIMSMMETQKQQKNQIIAEVNSYIGMMKSDLIQNISTSVSGQDSSRTATMIKTIDEHIEKIKSSLPQEILKNNSEHISTITEQLKLDMNKSNPTVLMLAKIDTFSSCMMSQLSQLSLEQTIMKEQQKKFVDSYEITSDKMKKVQHKGKIGEMYVQSLLETIYRPDNIVRYEKGSSTGDYIIKREDKGDLLIEVKNYEEETPYSQVEKFVRDVLNTNMNGIMISLTSSINKKRDFHVEIRNNNVLLYLSNENGVNSLDNRRLFEERIRTAIDTIDLIKLSFSEKSEDITLTSNQVDIFIRRCEELKLIKEELERNVKDYCKKTLDSLSRIEIASLCNMIVPNGSYDIIKCKYCDEEYEKKELKKHEQKCVKKNIVSESEKTLLSEKKYVCEGCGKIYKMLGFLTKHKKECDKFIVLSSTNTESEETIQSEEIVVKPKTLEKRQYKQ